MTKTTILIFKFCNPTPITVVLRESLIKLNDIFFKYLSKLGGIVKLR